MPVIDMEELASMMVSQWEKIPKFYRREGTIKRTLQCFVFSYLREKGLFVLADYFPPRVADRPIDIVTIDADDAKKITLALCIDELINLNTVKSLTAFESEKKVIFTIHPLEKKVKESKFFLREGIEHYHLKGPYPDQLTL